MSARNLSSEFLFYLDCIKWHPENVPGRTNETLTAIRDADPTPDSASIPEVRNELRNPSERTRLLGTQGARDCSAGPSSTYGGAFCAKLAEFSPREQTNTIEATRD